MLFDNVTGIARAAGLLLLLQAAPALLQAAPADDTGTGEDGTVENSQPGADTPLASQPFPRWPQRDRFKREIVPPPPPGPYMSSALSDFSVKGPAFSHDMKRPAAPRAGDDMQKFSPDRPWPDDLRGTERWKPANGYHYVAPPVMRAQPGPPRSGYGGGYRYPAYNRGPYRQPAYRTPAPRTPASRAPVSRGQAYRAPVMPMPPAGPYMKPRNMSHHGSYPPASSRMPAPKQRHAYTKPAYRTHHGTGYRSAPPAKRPYPAPPPPVTAPPPAGR